MDFTAGLDPSFDEVTADAPVDPEYREGTSMWLWDDAGRVTLPRIAIEVVGATWETARMLLGNVVLPDGRIFHIFSQQPALPVTNASGLPAVLGAGPMRFECRKPFEDWRFVYDGEALEMTVEDQMAGRAHPATDTSAFPRKPVRVELDTRAAAPAWKQGALGGAGFIPGEERFEQLFKAQGQVTVDGQTIPFSGGGLRIHRKGGARTPPRDFFGHCWQSAVFPSGRAFGLMAYYPRPDGSKKFVEAWAMRDDGQVLPAQIVSTPWMREMRPSGEDVSFILRTARGDIAITAETHASTFMPARKDTKIDGSAGATLLTNLQQGIARYRWGDEQAFGMIERSYMT